MRYTIRTSIALPGEPHPLSVRFSTAQLAAIDKARGDKPVGTFALESAFELLSRRGVSAPSTPDIKAASERDDLPLSTWIREVAAGMAGLPGRYLIKGL